MTRFLSTLLMAALLALSVSAAFANAGAPVSDDAIFDNVRRKLANDPDVRGGAFDVSVKDGVVTLKGKVEKEKYRQRAEKVAKKVKGVKQVVNQLQVAPR
jgi:hyperosmotically inducible periplasmic protein